jgi:hypothetical protein
VQLGSVRPEFGHGPLERVPVGADGAVGAHFAVAALVRHGNCGGIFVDIEAHESLNRFHVLVSFVGGYG